MAQHFPLSRGCRDLPVSRVLRLSEDEAYRWFKVCRWQATGGEPVCLRRGGLRCYELRRRRFRCSTCRTEFSVTSGTIFAFHKLRFGQILAAIAFCVNAVKGKAVDLGQCDLGLGPVEAMAFGHAGTVEPGGIARPTLR